LKSIVSLGFRKTGPSPHSGIFDKPGKFKWLYQ
jgi:hypothetical protein